MAARALFSVSPTDVMKANEYPVHTPLPISPGSDSDPPSPNGPQKTIFKNRNTSGASASKLNVKKKPGTRGKCKGCVKRDVNIDLEKAFRKNVGRRARSHRGQCWRAAIDLVATTSFVRTSINAST